MQTVPINNDPKFRALEGHANAGLSAKGYDSLARKGSTSWIDPRIKPADAAVRFKLCMLPNGIFFGAREECAVSVGINLATFGPVSEDVRPSSVKFRGDHVENTPAGKRKIDSHSSPCFHEQRRTRGPRRSLPVELTKERRGSCLTGAIIALSSPRTQATR